MQPNIVESLDAVLQLAAMPAEKVMLEITESRLPEDISKVMSSLTRLRLKGFEISIDDFGTGFLRWNSCAGSLLPS